MAGIALQGLKLGSQHIPDSAFEKIPFAGPRYFREDKDKQDQQDAQQRKRQSRRSRRDREREAARSDTDPYDTNPESDYERERRARRSHRRSMKEEPRKYDRGYDSDPESPALSRGYNDRPREQDNGSRGHNNGPSQGYDSNPYFPPPPMRAVDEPELRDRSDPNPHYRPYPDDSADYGANEGRSNEYYNGHPSADAAFIPPSGPPPAQRQRARFDNDSTRNGPSSSYSSVADKYRPHRDDRYPSPSSAQASRHDRDISPAPRDARSSPRPNYPSAVAVRPHSDYYGSQESLSPSYDSRYDDEENDRTRRQKRRSSKNNASSSRHRSSSRFSEARDKARDGFEQHKGELGAGALGALAGGLLGREFGGNGKRGNLGMVIGAALGGVGAGLYGKRQEKQDGRTEKQDGRMGSQDRRMPRREYAGYESQ